MKSETSIYGLMAEFEAHEQLLEAATKARDHGYSRMDGYSPFPIEGLPQALGGQAHVYRSSCSLGGSAVDSAVTSWSGTQTSSATPSI